MSEGRRRFGRFACQLPVDLVVGGATQSTHTVNLSLGGMLVGTDLEAPFGAEVEFRLHVPKPAHVVQARGTVMWASGEGKPALGVAFDALRPLDVWALLRYFSEVGEAAEAPVL